MHHQSQSTGMRKRSGEKVLLAHRLVGSQREGTRGDLLRNAQARSCSALFIVGVGRATPKDKRVLHIVCVATSVDQNAGFFF